MQGKRQAIRMKESDGRAPCNAQDASSYQLSACPKDDAMPTLLRFAFFCATAVAIVYGIMWSLVVFVEPRERDVTVRIPSERVNPPIQ